MVVTQSLFQPNAHSKWNILTRSASPAEATLVKGVAECMGIPVLTQHVWKIGEGVNSENFIANSLNDGIVTQLVFHRNRSPRKVETLQWIATLMEFLHAAEVPVPRLLWNRKNGSIATIVGEAQWQCSEYIESDGHFRGTPEELTSAGFEIAKLHCALHSYPNHLSNSPREFLGSLDWDVWESGLSAIDGSTYYRMVREHEQELHDMCDAAASFHREIPVSFQLIHGDIHPQNLLCCSGSVVAIIDFDDSMAPGPVTLDLANACHRLVRQAVCYAEGDPEKLPSLLGSFLFSYSRGWPLSREEIVTLPLYMREILLRKISDNIHLMETEGYPDATAVEEMERWLILLVEIDVFDRAIQCHLV